MTRKFTHIEILLNGTDMITIHNPEHSTLRCVGYDYMSGDDEQLEIVSEPVKLSEILEKSERLDTEIAQACKTKDALVYEARLGVQETLNKQSAEIAALKTTNRELTKTIARLQTDLERYEIPEEKPPALLQGCKPL